MDLVSFWLVIISLILFIAYAILIAYYRKGWLQSPEFIPPEKFQPTIRVTVIIPARNEEQHIINCLTSLQEQTYPSTLFEVIVVDDHSSDKTAALVESFPLSNLRLIRLKEYLQEQTNAYKKKGIELAIAQSTGDWIITTDADCIVPPLWIEMIMAFQESTSCEFIAGPVKFDADESLLHIFQAIDFLTMQGITAAAAFRNFHAMCNGANLAYSKKIFHEVNGFQHIDTLASGDDMFLMQKVRQQFPRKAGYLKNKNSIVMTEPAKSWKAFWQQRIRWSSKANKYDDKVLFRVLLLVYLFNFFLLALFIGSLFYPDTIFVALLLLICKAVVEFPFVQSVADFFNQRKLMFYFLILQPLHIVYIVSAGLFGQLGSYQWKGRKVK
jgi:cellulose synthase/poly-beta-1,6-N-acetylglucosamine synthase-like glycosyltransferase